MADRSRSVEARHRSVCSSGWSSDAEAASGQPDSPSLRPIETWLQLHRANFTANSSVDPFSSTAFPLSRPIEVMLKYFFTISMSGLHVDKSEVLPKHLQPVRRLSTVRDQSMRAILSDRIRFTSLMAAMSSRMKHMSQISLPFLNDPDTYIRIALRILRLRLLELQLSNRVADRTSVGGMISLALAAWLCQHYDAAVIHLRAVKELLPLLDGSMEVDKFTLEGVINIDKMVSIETGWLPVLPEAPAARFDPGPLEQSKRKEVRSLIDESGRQNDSRESSGVHNAEIGNPLLNHSYIDFLADAHITMTPRLGRAFEPFIEFGVVDSMLAKVLKDMIDVVDVGKLVWRTSSATREDAAWMCQRARFLNYQLLALPDQLPSPDTSLWAAKTEVLRIALVLVMLRVTNRMAFRSARPNMQRLKMSLSDRFPKLSTDWSSDGFQEWSREQMARTLSVSDENELLLWILLTGHFAALGEIEEEWFLLRCAFVARKLGIRTYEQLHEHMSGFFYSWTRQETSLRIVALHL
jgi:hypothetical protein